MIPQQQTSFRGVTISDGVRVHPTTKSFIKPNTPTEQDWLPLSNLDRVVNPTFSSVILYYKHVVKAKRTFRDVTSVLKESLGRALVYFYPLAGRLALGKDGLVDLHCNDEGAVFFEAWVDTELNAMGGPRPIPALSGMELARLGPGPRYIPDQLRAMPVLVIMVTQFKCGSISVGVNWHHTVADACSGCHFVKSWTEMAAGEAGPSLMPDHDRSILKPRTPPDPSLVNGYSTSSMEDLLERRDSEAATRRLPTEPIVLNSFHISTTGVQELKEKASGEDPENHRFTSATCLSAHLWRQLTKARADAKSRDAVTQFFIFVDGRKKLNLSPGYFGNAICSARARITEAELLGRPLAHAARLISEALRSVSGEYFQCLIDWVDVQGSAPSKSEHVMSMGRDVAATFWTSFPLYEMDFGWGRPELAVRNSPPRTLIDGIAVMPTADGATGGGMIALLNLHSDRMERLLAQPSFLRRYRLESGSLGSSSGM